MSQQADARPAPPASDGSRRAVRRARRRRLWLRRLAWGLGIAVVVYVAVAALLVWSARSSAQDGLDRLEEASETLTTADLLEGEGEAVLRAARGKFETANDRFGSPLLEPVRVLPVLGRQVRSLEDMSGAAAEVSRVSADGVAEAAAVVAGEVPAGPERVEALRELAEVSEGISSQIAVVDLGDDEALIGPVDSARQRLEDEVLGVEEALLRSRDAASALADLLEGPSRYLLLAGNNAEMRAGTGMFLSAGLLEMEDGRLTVGEMGPTADLLLPEGVPYLDEDLEARWGWMGPNREWRNLAASPRLEASAELATSMWEANGGPPVEGVVTVDVVALADLLGVTGPVEVDGEVVDQDNVLPLLLHDQYLDLDPADGEDQAARQDRLGDTAEAVMAQLNEVEDLPALVGALRSATGGRNLMAWSPDQQVQQAWRAAGVDGSIGADSLLVALLNRGGNKLDPFVSVETSLDTAAADDGTALTLEVTVTNDVPEGEPYYISGIDPDSVGGAGTYAGFLSIWFPEAATDIEMEDPDATDEVVLVANGPDGPTQVRSIDIRVPPGETRTYVARFRLPEGVDSLLVEPSARVPGMQWTSGAEEWSDDVEGARRIFW